MAARIVSAVAVAIGCALFSDAAHAAEDCKPLALVTSVDLVAGPDKRAEFVPVELNGVAKLMLLDTGGVFSELSNAVVDELHLTRQRGNFELYDVEGTTTSEFTKATLAVGKLKGDTAFPIWPGEFDYGGKVAGLLGPDILKHYDVSLDFGADKLDLLSQDHCEGKILYWSADAVAILPMQVQNSGHIVVSVMLDGQHLTAILDTGATSSTLTIPAVLRHFDFKLGSQDAPQSGTLTGQAYDQTYHHVFRTLDLDGLAVSNLNVEIIPDKIGHKLDNTPEIGTLLSNPRDDETKPVMLIGMDVLRHLHLYIAYKEENLYVTPASAPSAPH